MNRIKKNDLVHVISGKDKGKQGQVIEILPKEGKVKVKGIALQVRHVKPRKAGEAGGIKKKESFIAISNVMPVCPTTSKPCRIRARVAKDGKKERISHRSGEVF